MTEDFDFLTSKNEKISVTVYGFENISDSPVIICVHGFKGFKDWGFWPYIGNYFSKQKFVVLTFNFSHNGIDKNLFEISNLEKFANNTFSLEVKELCELISAYKNGYFGNSNNNKVILLGHSRGGADSIFAASGNEFVDGLITMSSISKLDRYTERQKAEWQEKKTWEVINSRTGQVMKLNISLLEDIEKYKSTTLNLENAVRKIEKPYLIIHGREDLTVPISEAEMLFSWSNKEKTKFSIIERSGHTFDIQHPFTVSNEKFNKVLSEIECFLLQFN